MRTTRSDLDWVLRITVGPGTRCRSEVSLTSLQGSASVGTHWLPEEDMGRSPLSEYVSLHPSLIHNRNINPCENKEWEMYFYKEVCSFVHWSSPLSLIMFPLIFVFQLCNTKKLEETCWHFDSRGKPSVNAREKNSKMSKKIMIIRTTCLRMDI